MNINIASTTGWLCEAGKDNRGGRVKRGFRTRTRLTKSLQNLLWDTIEPQSTHPMAPGRLAASLGRYLGARPKHVFLLAQRGIYLFMCVLSGGFRAATPNLPRTCTWRCQDRTKPMAVRVAIIDQRIDARAECERDGMDWEASYAEYYTAQGHRRGEHRVLNVQATIALDGRHVGRIRPRQRRRRQVADERGRSHGPGPVPTTSWRVQRQFQLDGRRGREPPPPRPRDRGPADAPRRADGSRPPGHQPPHLGANFLLACVCV